MQIQNAGSFFHKNLKLSMTDMSKCLWNHRKPVCIFLNLQYLEDWKYHKYNINSKTKNPHDIFHVQN